jgi:hypothetical protein
MSKKDKYMKGIILVKNHLQSRWLPFDNESMIEQPYQITFSQA